MWENNRYAICIRANWHEKTSAVTFHTQPLYSSAGFDVGNRATYKDKSEKRYRRYFATGGAEFDVTPFFPFLHHPGNITALMPVARSACEIQKCRQRAGGA